ncbi:hypothetical protein MAC_00672 [Metarhizium acridum CQMa 102]|uniref:Uncharacterized protein n=1 Tax=Metarhizium acridum (strain CQMa 102) TaxID=655827 RepID=E9DSS4_METAQ|nr:uncharacterized protein MAC_00672 [Metarhizium acridum CQMa 102]EFY93434.1 hypothetical protein MAC_00672 [Metarhizium acridum CQMa 102]
MLYTRLQSLLRDRRRARRDIEISAPFDLKLEPATLPGVSQEEISILREKAAASRIGVLELRPEFPSEYHRMSRPSPRLRAVQPATMEIETRPLWY